MLDKVDADVIDLAAITAGIQVHSTVHHQVVSVGAIAVDGLASDAETGRGGHLVQGSHRHPRYQSHQFQVIAAVQRQVLHLFGIDCMREFASSGIHRLTHHLRDSHGLIGGADLEFEIRSNTSSVRQVVAGLSRLAEARSLHLHVINAHRKIGDNVESAWISRRLPDQSRRLADDGDFRVGYNSGRLVGNGSGNSTVTVLREGRSAYKTRVTKDSYRKPQLHR